MKIIKTIAAMRELHQQWQREFKKIVLVPTMGNLHEGHLSLVDLAKDCANEVIVSIFVNPMQFGLREDYVNYPQTITEDLTKLQDKGISAVFMPDSKEMYPAVLSRMTYIKVPELSDILCAVTRPQFFQGVTTIVAKLFQIVRPDIAVFGKKDYQQWRVIQRMVSELNFPIDIIVADIVREGDGLAMSSRNAYLSPQQRQSAPTLYKLLKAAALKVKQRKEPLSEIEQIFMSTLIANGFIPDYFSIRRQSDLRIPEKSDSELVILAAANLATTRLIDNIEVSVGVT